MMQWNGWKSFGRAAAAGLLIAVGGGGVMGGPPALAQGQNQAEPGQDVLIFANGTVMYGKIVSETASSIRFKGKSHGLEFETEYQKANILEIKRAKDAPAGEAKPATPSRDTGRTGVKNAPPVDDGVTKTPYYWIKLDGNFGEQITQTPIRQAIDDAKKQNAEVIILELDAAWKDFWGMEDLPDDYAAFDEIFRAEDIVPIITQEVPRDWDNPPKFVIWVKQAMGGSALLPMVINDVYFSSNARLGGLGDLTIMFGNTGDEVVRQKQISLRMGHAQGWAIAGGHDPRIINALADIQYTLSVGFRDGKPYLYEGMPNSASDELLTDDGMGPNVDSVQARVAGEGNDVLTLNARTAKLIGFSRGTVDTRDELLIELGLDRAGVDVSNRSDRIMDDWERGLDNAKRQLRRLVDEYGDVRVMPPGDYAERTKARGQQLRILESMKSLLRRWGEGIDVLFLRMNGIPSEEQINVQQEAIRLQQLSDRK